MAALSLAEHPLLQMDMLASCHQDFTLRSVAGSCLIGSFLLQVKDNVTRFLKELQLDYLVSHPVLTICPIASLQSATLVPDATCFGASHHC